MNLFDLRNFRLELKYLKSNPYVMLNLPYLRDFYVFIAKTDQFY